MKTVINQKIIDSPCEATWMMIRVRIVEGKVVRFGLFRKLFTPSSVARSDTRSYHALTLRMMRREMSEIIPADALRPAPHYFD